MDEKGYGSEIATAVLVLALMFSIGVLASSVENTYDEFNTAKEGQDDRTVYKAQTDVVIENAIYYPADDNLVVIIRNTGSTELDVSETDLIVDGSLVAEENIKSKSVEGIQTNVWLPEENLTIVTENIFPNQPERVKLVTGYGVSDYTTNIT